MYEFLENTVEVQLGRMPKKIFHNDFIKNI